MTRLNGLTIPDIEKMLEDLKLTWKDVNMARSDSDNTCYVIKISISVSGRYRDTLRVRVHPSAVQAAFNRVLMAKVKT